MRPFWTYYGGKWRIAPRYPAPLHATIVEPFAGSAGYALRWPAYRVVLVEADPVVASVWRYLIGVPAKEIRALPDIAPGEDVKSLAIAEEAQALIGFWLTRGGAAPNRTLSAWGREPRYSRQFWGAAARERIASQVDAIRHWRIIEGDYTDAPTLRATWFVDPPYQVAGKHYGHRVGDYAALAAWCRSRPGQVIACENTGADWLPFEHLVDAKANATGGKRSREAVWLSGAGQMELELEQQERLE